ncbi:hypothetical protein [Kutzneria buriramensis]|uniref:hypothetical protein n=1 Tax=Kutzneria buriramensis TaxID=1045776 RepID=UPI0011C0FF76|nr:hypothetical protein [Kutzneria buriramensis]
MQVWERLVVIVDGVLLLDDGGAVQGRWALPASGQTGPRLYDALVLAGAPLTSDPARAWVIGRPEWVELLVAATNNQVLTVRDGGAPMPLRRRLTDMVLDVYRRYLDDDAT